MQKSQGAKSTARRRPLRDLSNGLRPPGSHRRKQPRDAAAAAGDAALDRLLLARSDLAGLVSQIDELVAQALQCKTISKRGNQETESFSRFLSDINSSLKPWSSRLKQAFEAAPEERENVLKHSMETCSVSAARRDDNLFRSDNNLPETDLVVSPSPLVSWRAGACMVESGKQLFLLTPLPKTKACSSRCPRSSKTTVKTAANTDKLNPPELPVWKVTISNDDHADLQQSMKVKEAWAGVLTPRVIEATSASENGLFSPFGFSTQKSRRASIFLSSPCLKTALSSKQRLLAPISEGSRKEDVDSAEPTQNDKPSEVSDGLSAEEVSENLAARYQDLFGLNPTSRLTNRRREVDETLDWFLSPPKTCVLMNPSDEKPLQTPADNSKIMLGTPWKGLESTNLKGKQAGETTLKKELWTRFEAVSTNELHLDKSIFRKSAGKRFLDMLEEVS